MCIITHTTFTNCPCRLTCISTCAVFESYSARHRAYFHHRQGKDRDGERAGGFDERSCKSVKIVEEKIEGECGMGVGKFCLYRRREAGDAEGIREMGRS